MSNPTIPALLALVSLLAACTRGDSDVQVKERAHALLLQQCRFFGRMIPGVKDAQLKVHCNCSADRGVAAIGMPDLRALLKDDEFGRDAERVMKGIRDDCAKVAGID